LLVQALRLHQAGRLQEAGTRTRATLPRTPTSDGADNAATLALAMGRARWPSRGSSGAVAIDPDGASGGTTRLRR